MANIPFVPNNPGPASDNTPNLGGGAAVAWANSAGTAFIGPTGSNIVIAPGQGGFAITSGPVSRIIWPTRVTQGGAAGNGTLSFQYFAPSAPISATRLDCLFNVSAASTTTSNTAAIGLTAIGGIYSQITGSALTLLSSGSTQTTYSYASNNSGQTQLLAAAIRPVSVPMNINITAEGEYFVAFAISSSQSSIGAATTALAFNMSIMADLDMQTASNYAEFTAATASTSGLYGYQGIYTSTTLALPASIAQSLIAQTGANALAGNYQFVMRNY